MSTAKCASLLKQEFPSIDVEMKQYIEGVLDSGMDDFDSSDDLYDAIGVILHEVSEEKSENDIRDLCEQLLCLMKPSENKKSGTQKVLDAPINIAEMAANNITNVTDVSSIWVINRDDNLKVDSKKLEKAQQKLQQKQDKRSEAPKAPVMPLQLQTATASQVINKKESQMDAKGTNRSMDIRIENFDVSFGNKVLLQNADLLLAHGRRYGLVGRNGLGKTTLLRMISGKQLQIPAHISILHVEQEVIGDDTTALNSVLECDFERTRLLAEEKKINIEINVGSSNPELNKKLTEVYAALENIDADRAPARASVILNGLGFNKDMQARATKTFSGGWRMRLALARALFSRPDLLLLDEPTNMLDIKAIIWLENYLQNWPSTLLVVSHDRNFLDTVPTDILHLHTQRIDVYRGNYEQFDKTRTEKLKSQRREFEAQLAHRQHVQEFIDRFRYNANRAASVQSKIKMLEKLPELKPVEKEIEVVIKFPDVEPLNPPVLTLNEIAFKYNKDKVIFTCVNLCANLDSRICIVGENGAGKTTLLKIIMGILSSTSGTISQHRGLKIGYFAQHHVDQLNMNTTCVGLLQEAFPGRPVEEYRRQLGGFGISGDLALQLVASLSGGQKSRVTLAKMCMARPNFLILDEPTNHLDIETIAALGKALTEFKGGLVLVSHDERLIRMVCKELWVCGNGTVTNIEGGIDYYKQLILAELNEATK